jgi:hypothetical protein
MARDRKAREGKKSTLTRNAIDDAVLAARSSAASTFVHTNKSDKAKENITRDQKSSRK